MTNNKMQASLARLTRATRLGSSGDRTVRGVSELGFHLLPLHHRRDLFGAVDCAVALRQQSRTSEQGLLLE